MSMVSSRRTLYPPWRILLYRTFQERMLTMVLGLHPEAKEKLLGIMSASNKFLMYYMREPPEIAAIFKHISSSTQTSVFLLFHTKEKPHSIFFRMFWQVSS